MNTLINRTVLMSGAEYFDDNDAINAHMDAGIPVDHAQAIEDHKNIREALERAGITIIQVEPPADCQDGVYTANWALVRGEKAVMARLPNKRRTEEPYAQKVLRNLGKEIILLPEGMKFSGQGDALPCGDYLFAGSQYRTDPAAHDMVGQALGYEVISLQTRPHRRWFGLGPPIINATSGWPDSYYYDIDLALSVLRGPSEGHKGLIAWCPEAFTRASRQKLRAFDGVEKIEVSRREATAGLACNLVSTGETVIMSAFAPRLRTELEKRGFTVIPITATELRKGGGFIRCTTLTLDN